MFYINMNIYIIFYCVYILSFFGKSINVNYNNNKLTILSHRLRNTSIRLLLFNDFCKLCREKMNEIIRLKQISFNGNIGSMQSHFYDITYSYYSMDEERRENLELVLSLLC